MNSATQQRSGLDTVLEEEEDNETSEVSMNKNKSNKIESSDERVIQDWNALLTLTKTFTEWKAFLTTSIVNLFRRRNTICIFGLDGSGKTSIVNNLKRMNSNQLLYQPTVGFSTCTITRNRHSCKVIDCGGKSNYRSLWKQFLQPNQTSAIIFVIDSLDKQRFGIAKLELQHLITYVHDHISSHWYQSLKKTYQTETKPLLPILILCNKQEESQSIPLDHIKQLLTVEYDSDTILLHFMGCNAKENHGVEEAWNWLLSKLFIHKRF